MNEQIGPTVIGKEALKVLHAHLDFVFGLNHMPTQAEQDAHMAAVNDLRVLMKNESEVLSSADWCIFGVIPLLARIDPKDLVPLAMQSVVTPFQYGG
jgi:hypothetical protein